MHCQKQCLEALCASAEVALLLIIHAKRRKRKLCIVLSYQIVLSWHLTIHTQGAMHEQSTISSCVSHSVCNYLCADLLG